MTEAGQPLTIVRPGQRNTNSGPDFSDARIRVGEINWVGSVEIHVKASDWNAHQHQYDEAYNRVVLHVVWENDRPVYRADHTLIPTLELKSRVSPTLLQNYRHLVFQGPDQQDIPCAALLPQVDPLKKVSMLDRAAVLRLSRKSEDVRRLLDKNRGDWANTAYQMLLRSFGFGVNTAALEQLGYALPWSLLMKYQHDFDATVALLLGQAGLLVKGEWPAAWQDTYRFLSSKHQLKPLRRSQWQFFRTRPANFPTVRVVQLAAVLTASTHRIEDLFALRTRSEYLTVFRQGNRYLADNTPTLGEGSIDKLLINAVVPYRFAQAEQLHQQHEKDQVLTLLQSVPAEKNRLVSKYKAYGFVLQSAFDTQAVLELDRTFCQAKRCLSCAIGTSIIKDQEIFVSSETH